MNGGRYFRFTSTDLSNENESVGSDRVGAERRGAGLRGFGRSGRERLKADRLEAASRRRNKRHTKVVSSSRSGVSGVCDELDGNVASSWSGEHSEREIGGTSRHVREYGGCQAEAVAVDREDWGTRMEQFDLTHNLTKYCDDALPHLFTFTRPVLQSYHSSIAENYPQHTTRTPAESRVTTEPKFRDSHTNRHRNIWEKEKSSVSRDSISSQRSSGHGLLLADYIPDYIKIFESETVSRNNAVDHWSEGRSDRKCRETGRIEEKNCDTMTCDMLARRQKQIDFGYNTEGYKEYLKAVPKFSRTRHHPRTPDKHNTYSRRGWDSLIKFWRRQLHAWDPSPSSPIPSSCSLPHPSSSISKVASEEMTTMSSVKLEKTICCNDTLLSNQDVNSLAVSNENDLNKSKILKDDLQSRSVQVLHDLDLIKNSDGNFCNTADVIFDLGFVKNECDCICDDFDDAEEGTGGMRDDKFEEGLDFDTEMSADMLLVKLEKDAPRDNSSEDVKTFIVEESIERRIGKDKVVGEGRHNNDDGHIEIKLMNSSVVSNSDDTDALVTLEEVTIKPRQINKVTKRSHVMNSGIETTLDLDCCLPVKKLKTVGLSAS